MKKIISITGVLLFAATNAWARCPYNTTFDPKTNTCSKSGCDGDCTVVYSIITNNENQWDAVVKPKAGVQGEIVLKEGDLRYQDKVRDLTVSEGITGLGSTSVWSNGSGTLKLPSTLKTMEWIAIYNVGYETIDVSDVKNFQSSTGAYQAGTQANTIAINGATQLKNLIVSEDTSLVGLGYAYEQFTETEVEIQCKGSDLNKCEKLVLLPQYYKSRIPETFSISSDFYVKEDENGNILEQWGPLRFL